MRSRGFCFTFNNYTTDTIEKIKKISFLYLCYGKEIAPTTGTPHLQGYIHFKNARTLVSARKLGLGHVEKANGTAQQSKIYCSKSGDFKEFGTIPSQGQRSDLAVLCESVRTGKATMDDILITDPMAIHQYGRTLQKCEDFYFRTVKRTEMTTCTWLVGPTGSGKSHKAYTENPDAYDYPFDGEWMDGYRAQETMIINDFRGQIPYSTLLRLIDKWPVSVRIRCSQPRPFVSKHIVITSCKTPQECYNNLSANDNISQLLRRVTIIQMGQRSIITL